jgi:CHAD domain-containing protein
MMIDGKWIEGLGPLLTAVEAARLALQVRFEVVRYYLPLAMHDSDKDHEHVHRLRVGTRRAGAALRIFASVLPEKLQRKAKKTLRSIRQSAGAARDWDVFIDDLRARLHKAAERDKPGLDFLIGYAAGQRDAAQAALITAGQEHEEDLKSFVSLAVQTLQDTSLNGAPLRFEELGRKLLRELMQELSWAAARNLDDYEHLHQVRILGKQLRYAMEVFASCFADDFRNVLYPRVEQMQEILGMANDSHVAWGRLESLKERFRAMWPEDWKLLQPGIDKLLRFHRTRLPRQREAFLQWWQEWQSVNVPRMGELMTPSITTQAVTTTP